MKRNLTLIVFCLSCFSSFSQCSEGINQTFAILNFGSGNVYYNLQSSSGNPPFEDANLGSFCPYGTLILEGGQNQVYKCNGADIWQNQIWYRIYPTSSSPTGSFTPITEYYQSGYSNGCGGADQTWEANGANINVLIGLSAGTYYLEVYSTADYQYCGSGTLYASNGSYNYRAQFTVNAATASVNNATVCTGTTATLTATGGTSYVWSTGATTSSITTTTAGTYHVTATTSSGCTATASGTVSIHPNPSPHAGRDTTVGISSSVVLGDTLPIGGTPPYTFVWTPGVGLSDTTIRRPIATPVVNTNYIVQATDSFGCTGRDTVTVFYNDRYDPLTAITYSARNQSIDTVAGQTYLSFDIFATDTPSLLFSQGNIFITYDSILFGGTNLVSNGKVTASKGLSVDSAFYNLSLSDSTSTILKISIAHIANATSLSNLDSLNQQLCRLRFDLSGFNLTNVGAYFDTVAMAQNSQYKRSVSGLDFPYNKVFVSGLVGAQQVDNSITFNIVNKVLDDPIHPTHLDFDILGHSNVDEWFGDYNMAISYNTYAFDSIYITNVLGPGDNGSGDSSGSGCCGGDSIYSFVTNFYPGIFNISLSADSNFDLTDYLQTWDFIDSNVVAHVRMHIYDCGYTPDISIIPIPSADWVYPDTFPTILQPYAPVLIDSGTYNNGGNVMCPPMPHINDWSPDCASAGSFQVLTINGRHFGDTTGTVYFTNADPPPAPAFVATYPQDIKHWDDGQIQVLIPSQPESHLISGSGVFYVQAHDGRTDAADSEKISIAYANYNVRNNSNPLSADYNTAMFVYYPDSVIILHPDSAFWANQTAVTTLEQVMADLNCRAGFSFSLSSTLAPIDSPQVDHIRLISLKPYSPALFGPNDLVVTELINRANNEYNGLAAYNNWADYLYDGDITIRADLPFGYTWNWNSGNIPGGTQIDFLTVMEHELGHYALLCHALPQYSGYISNAMYYLTPPGYQLPDYSSDPDNMLGVINALTVGRTIGAADGVPGKFSFYSCPSLVPPACAPRIATTNGIADISGDNSNFTATLYPNPYQDNTIVHIEASVYEKFNITVYDMLGQILKEVNVAGGTSIDVPLSGFEQAAGMYLVEVSDGHSGQVLKLIKL